MQKQGRGTWQQTSPDILQTSGGPAALDPRVCALPSARASITVERKGSEEAPPASPEAGWRWESEVP